MHICFVIICVCRVVKVKLLLKIYFSVMCGYVYRLHKTNMRLNMLMLGNVIYVCIYSIICCILLNQNIIKLTIFLSYTECTFITVLVTIF